MNNNINFQDIPPDFWYNKDIVKLTGGTRMNRLFSDKELRLLIVPLIIEQILAITVGMADTMMISYAGEAAISGVALVDLINLLLMNVFAALATGGAVVSSQYLGKGNKDMCRESAGQLLIVTTLISLIIMAAVLLTKRHFLGLLYPSVAREVMDNAVTYLRISAYSYPFLAVFNSCAALFRSMGNSKISMKVSVLMNLINVTGNAVLIFGFSMGVAGAAWATAFSRGVAALIMVWLLRDRRNVIYINLRSLCRLNGSVIRKILYIGIPNGIENGLFQLGRVLIVSIIAGFGTVQIAANAVANNLDNMGLISGMALNLAMVTVVGRCVGAKDYEQVEYYVKKLMKTAYIAGAVVNGLVLLSMPLALNIYSLTPETAELTKILVWIHCAGAIVMWPVAFTLPNALRAANDVRMPMVTSVFSMVVFRILFSVILGIHFQMGVIGVWIAMIMDWIFRLTLFILRYRKGKWKQMNLI